ncbi:MAG: hypothetical protein PHD40_05955 [Syntrophomonadaceae bacterium]|nr:hypothetical protein [Syntrophomonadaceae bacterium]
MSIRKKRFFLALWIFGFALPLVAYPLIALGQSSYEQYMPQQQTLPGGFQLMEIQEYEHAVYGANALSGVWQIRGIGYQYSPRNEPQGKNDREWIGWMNQQDMEAAVYIHVVIGEKTAVFDKHLDHFSSQGGIMNIPWSTMFDTGGPTSLGVDEDQAVHLSFPPGYMFSKGNIGVLVLSSPGDLWHWEKLGLSTSDVDKVLFTIAQSIGKSIPGSDQGIGGITGGDTTSDGKTGQQIPSATILLATALSGLVLTGGALANITINRPAIAPASPPTNSGVPHIGEERNGQVWYKPPWDQGGPMWISKSDYNQIKNMTAQGKVWSDRWGWTDPEAVGQNEAFRARNWSSFTQQDKTAQAATEAIGRSRQGYRQSMQNIFNHQRRYELEIEQIRNLQEAGKAAKNVAYWENVCRNTEAVSRTADMAINIMGKVVPGGGYVSDGYTVLRGAAEGLGNAMAEGGNYSRHIAKGTAQGVYDLAMDKAKDKAMQGIKSSGQWSKIKTDSSGYNPVFLVRK